MKRFATCTVASILATATWATDFVWTGNGGAAANWTHPVNWSVGGATANTYPQTDDTVTFSEDASVTLDADVTVAGITLGNGARVVVTSPGKWLKSSSFSGTGVLALDGTRLTGISTAAASWEVNVVIPSTFGIEIVQNATESRIVNTGDKTRLQIDGPLTGTGTLRIGYTGSGLGGVLLCGDNSAFQGKLIIDGASAARNRFGTAQAGGEEMTLDFQGNTTDNGSVDFTDGVLKFGSVKTSSRTMTNYAWRFNNSGTNILEVGHLGKSDDRISIKLGENNVGTGHLKIRKVGTGTLELWNPCHRYGTEIDNGILLVTSDKALNRYADGDITFGHDSSVPGGILKYGVNQWDDNGAELETPVDVTTDYSALIKNSFAPVAIDTDGKDVTFATALANSNVGGITKLGAGTLSLSAWQTLLAPAAVSNGMLYVKVNAAVTGRVDVAEGATLAIYGSGKNFDNSTVHGAGTIRFIQEDGQTRHFRLGPNADFSDFTGTVEFVATNAQTTADGLVNASWNNHLEGATLLISGAPASPVRMFDMERSVVVGAYQQTNANLQVQVKQNQTLTFGEKSGATNILNGPIINSSIKLVKNGASKVTVGPGFSVVDGSTLTINAGTFELAKDMNYSGISSFTAIASGVALAGEGVFGAVNLSVNDVVVPDTATFTDKTATYPILTATSFSGTSANVTALLNTLNANEKSGSWRVRAVPTGNGAYTLTIAYSKSGFMIIFK